MSTNGTYSHALHEQAELYGRESSQGEDAPVLEAVHLHKEFPLRSVKLFGPKLAVHAVEDTSLALHPGRATALVGESGSGKTTVARVLSGMYAPTSGTIRFQGRAVNLRNRRRLREYHRQVQLIFQDPFSSLNPVHTVSFHLSRPLRIHRHVQNKDEERQMALALLERVNLTPATQFLEKYPHQLSGGQRQRVAIARALAVQPEVILADEPVSMLDVSIRLDVLNLLLHLKTEEKLGFLFITHDLASARYFAEETVVMYAGQIMEGGPSAEVIQHPLHPYTQLLLSAAPDPERMGTSLSGKHLSRNGFSPTIPASGNRQPVQFVTRGEPPSLINPPKGCRFHLRCPYAMPVCREQFPPRTEKENGHWTHCFLYSEPGTSSQHDSAPTQADISSSPTPFSEEDQ
jgi:peptide/nickel transport system ATP-binding protein